MEASKGVPLAERTVGPVVREVGLRRCRASVVVTKVPVAPESRMAVRGGATSGKETGRETMLDETVFLIVLTRTEGPPRQVEEGNQKQRLVLPPCMLVKVAVAWCPGDLLLHSLLLCAQAPWDQQYMRGPGVG